MKMMLRVKKKVKQIQKTKIQDFPGDLMFSWKEVNPPNTEDQIAGKYVACLFSCRVANLFIFKILRSYLADSVEEE